MQSRLQLDNDLRTALATITCCKHEKNEIIAKVINKLQLLTILPFTEYNESNIVINKMLLDDILSENAELVQKVATLKNEFQRRNGAVTPLKTQKLKKPVVTPKKVAVTEFQNDDGLIENTYGYRDYQADGTPKVFTKKDLDTHNFHTLLRFLLSEIIYPNCDYLGPILNWKLAPFNSNAVASISGPEDSSVDDETFGLLASAKVISLYPHCKGRPYREGDPICDRYHLKLFQNAAILCLTDGCNWGDKPRRAARVANKTMVSFVERNIPSLNTIQDAVHMLVAAVADAQLAIVDGPEETWMGGKTTANIGVLLEIDQPWIENNIINEVNDIKAEEFQNTIIPSKWVFVCVNVGDCKVLHFSKDTKAVFDVTAVSRNDYLDLTDPGGRLGPYKGLWPDTRNLAAFWIPLQEGDIIASMSDGVHDNLDPQIQGLPPSAFGSDAPDWESAPTSWVIIAKQSYLRHFTEHLIGDTFTPKHIKDTLINHCIQNTDISRDYLSTNPASKTPGGYDEYPGKLDHASFACFRVGGMNEMTRLLPSVEVTTNHISFSMEERPTKPSKNTLDDVIQFVRKDLENFAASGGFTQNPGTIKPQPFPVPIVTKEPATGIRKRIRSVRHSEISMLSPLRSAQLLKKKNFSGKPS